jgi:tetratricopeptide (TPR) repeat protein
VPRLCLSIWLASAALSAAADSRRFELAGRIEPAEAATVSIFGAFSSFSSVTHSDAGGRFRFRNLAAGEYTVAVFIAGRGVARVTTPVGPGTSDARHRVSLTLRLKDADFDRSALAARHVASAGQLAVPEQAQREFERALADLARTDAAAAAKRLERAVTLAPKFSAAWNLLGTIAYHASDYVRAEQCFRESLAADPGNYDPLVNLGGVLINSNQLDEAIGINLRALLARPGDALANAQLGLAYFHAGAFELAEKYLVRARDLDPAHFSHPQLTLAEIHLRQGHTSAAAGDLEDFLARHPDYPSAARMREKIAELRK